MYEKTTKDISVKVQPRFLREQSDPDTHQYLWAYHVEIMNEGDDTVQLLNRHWKITDGMGRTQVVRGPGVVGEQPVLKPGESFEYTSGCPLSTPTGMMVGEYEMIRPDTGAMLHIDVPAFSLDSPFMSGSVN